jgi:Trk-type K+ transport system membrane component
MVLIVLGGLGFPVLSNIGTRIIAAVRTRTRCRLSLHSKLVLLTTVILLVVGSVGIFLLEQNGILRDLSFAEKTLASVFHSVTSRTAGFNVLNTGSCTVPTLFLLILLMWIGASPGSTGGGIKTTTAALTILKMHAIASGRTKVEIFRKRVPEIAITKAFTTVLLSFFFVAGALFCLLLTEHGSFEQLLFEVVSALSTVGLSTGITPQLTLAGKLIITICMIAGRVGLLAIIIALTPRRFEGRYGYTEENILIT